MKNITIKWKIFLYVCLLTISALLIISIVILSLFSQTLKRNEINNLIQSSNKTKQNIEFFLRLINNTGTSLASNNDVVVELNRNYNPLDPSYIAGQSKINSMLQNVIVLEQYIRGIYLVNPKGNFYTSDFAIKQDELVRSYNLQNNNQFPIKEYFTSIHKVTYSAYSNVDTISYLRPIFEFGTGNYLGAIIIDINYDSLKEMITMASIESDEKVLIVNQQGETIFSFPYLTILDDIIINNPELLNLKKQTINKKVFGKDSIIVSNTVDYSGWKIIRIIPMDKIHQDTLIIKKVAIFMLILFLFLSLSVSLILSHTLTKPISELNKKIKLVENGDLSVNIKVKSTDELGQLSNSFNNMVVKIKGLLDKSLEEQKKKSDIEFKILQSQINPHFLYNTLDSIRWLAAIHNMNNISDMTTAIINLLKYNISKNDSSVTLAEEIDSINNYIKIQKYRYGDMFRIKYYIEENTLNCRVLRFMLQPIVENAIFHGFESIEGNGLITISSKINEDKLHIDITDNGIGIDDATLSTIVNNNGNKFNGIGVKNIEERIKLYFGEQYGLRIISKPSFGTRISLILPCDFDHKGDYQ